MHSRLLIVTAALLTALSAATADAGCGCSKPPPVPAPVRPSVAYPGAPITLFSHAFAVDASYVVTFTSALTGASQSVTGIGTSRRDLAGGGFKAQVEVPLPNVAVGPLSIVVTATDAATPILSIADTDFTATTAPLPIPNALGTWQLPGAQGAVGRNGVVYLALDLTNMQEPMVVTAQALGYPLRFTENDIVFYNRQGFVMQRLVENSGAKTVPVPGMFVVGMPGADSDELHYSRHEFVTYFLDHAERKPHSVDETDGNWHHDGTPHIDHDHLILAIAGRLSDGTQPSAGATPLFDLKLATYSLFHAGVMASQLADVGGSSIVDSYDSVTALRGTAAAVSSLTAVKVRDTGLVMGDAIAPTVTFEKQGTITGDAAAPAYVGSLMAIKIPTGIPNLRDLDLKTGVYTLTGPGSFQVHKLKVGGTARLFIDNTAGPVTIYATDEVAVTDKAAIDLADPRPERFAIYATSGKPVQFNGTTRSAAAVYAPNAPLTFAGDANVSGAFVAKTVATKDRARVHYASRLRGVAPVTDCLQMTKTAPVAGKPFDAKVQCVNGEKMTVAFAVTGVTSETSTCILVAADPKTLKPMSSLGFNVKVQCDVPGAAFMLAIEGIS